MFQDRWLFGRMCNREQMLHLDILPSASLCSWHFQFIRVGPTPAGFCLDVRHLSVQGMEPLGNDERGHISSHQRWEQCWEEAAGCRHLVFGHCSVGISGLNNFILVKGTNLHELQTWEYLEKSEVKCYLKWLTAAFWTRCTQNGQAGAQLLLYKLWFTQNTFASVARCFECKQ